MDAPIRPRGAGSLKRGPRVAACYLCGRSYGVASLKIHQKSCKALWVKRENLKPRSERKPLPEAPQDFEELVSQGVPLERALAHTNAAATESYNNKALERCPNCTRTFLPEALVRHNRSCTPENPAKPPPSRTRGPRPSSATPQSPAAQSPSPQQRLSNRNARRQRPASAAPSRLQRSADSYSAGGGGGRKGAADTARRPAATQRQAVATQPASTVDAEAWDEPERSFSSTKREPDWESYLDGHTGLTYYHNRLTGETQWEPPVQASPPSPSFQPRGEPAVITRDHGRPRDAAHVHAAAFEDAARAPQVPPAVLATLTSLMSRMAAMQDELNSMSVELAGVCSLLTIHRSTTNTRRGEPARDGGGDGFRQ